MLDNVNDVPIDLKRLLRYVLKAFYEPELCLIMDLLLMYRCINEDAIASILKLELKPIRQHINTLKAEKFIAEKPIMETTSDGKNSKNIFYYIDFKMMVNVIKYKLEKMRQQIEIEEKTVGVHASATYKCINCGFKYTALDIVEIYFTMRCNRCDNGQVEEDETAQASCNASNIMYRYNTQMKKIFDLLQRVENIHLAPELVRPSPIDIKHDKLDQFHQNRAEYLSNNIITSKGDDIINNQSYKWSGDATRNIDLFAQTSIKINFQQEDDTTSLMHKTDNLLRQTMSTPSLTSLAVASSNLNNNTNNSLVSSSINLVLNQHHNGLDLIDSTLKSNTTLSSLLAKLINKTNLTLIPSSNGFNNHQDESNSEFSDINGNNNNNKTVNLDDEILRILLIYEKKGQQHSNGNSTITHNGNGNGNSSSYQHQNGHKRVFNSDFNMDEDSTSAILNHNEDDDDHHHHQFITNNQHNHHHHHSNSFISIKRRKLNGKLILFQCEIYFSKLIINNLAGFFVLIQVFFLF